MRKVVHIPSRKGPAWQNSQLLTSLFRDKPDVFWGGNGYLPLLSPKKTKLILMISLAIIIVVTVLSYFNYFSNLHYIDTKLKTQDLPNIADKVASRIRVNILPFVYGSIAMANDTFKAI